MCIRDSYEYAAAGNGPEQFYRGTLRSGQVISSESSVTIIGDVNPVSYTHLTDAACMFVSADLLQTYHGRYQDSAYCGGKREKSYGTAYGRCV